MDRQIAIHREYQSRQAAETTAATRLQTTLNRLEDLATANDWSQTKLAHRIGIKESTFRKIKAGQADIRHWLPKLEAAASRIGGAA